MRELNDETMVAPVEDIARLRDLLHGRRVLALTGAGCSTESGIPDYRGPKTKHKERNPIRYGPFMEDAAVRQRYWARASVGWPWFRAREPNVGHYAMARLEQEGVLTGIITQNVDRLHHKAGSRRVVELHGAIAEVRCMKCAAVWGRDDVQRRILELNPSWRERSVEYAPDGDAVLTEDAVRAFVTPSCPGCRGILKPNVVFFGENVPKPVVNQAWAMLDEADVLLVVGSSLTVYSGYRFVRKAAERGIPVAIVTIGETRGDKEASLIVQGRSGDVMPRLADALLC